MSEPTDLPSQAPGAAGGPAGPAPTADASRPGAAPAPSPAGPVAAPAVRAGLGRGLAVVAGLAVVFASVAIALAWQAGDRVARLEAELVRRQQVSTERVAEARLAARQAEEQARDAVARATLLELKLAELSAARADLDGQLQALTRSRDERLLLDLGLGLRGAMQQASLTGSADAVLLALRDAEERLAGVPGAAAERVRRAVALDLERVKTAAPPDPAALAARLDEAWRSVDTLPLLAQAVAHEGAPAPSPMDRASTAAGPAGSAASAGSAGSAAPQGTAGAEATGAANATAAWSARVSGFVGHLWAAVRDEVRRLVRLTPIEHPEAAMLAPDQAVFLREQLKLRLLSARLAVLTRRHDTARADLQAARALLERYFDRRARAVQSLAETLRQAAAQARPAPLPRPEATLSAIAAVAAQR